MFFRVSLPCLSYGKRTPPSPRSQFPGRPGVEGSSLRVGCSSVRGDREATPRSATACAARGVYCWRRIVQPSSRCQRHSNHGTCRAPGGRHGHNIARLQHSVRHCHEQRGLTCALAPCRVWVACYAWAYDRRKIPCRAVRIPLGQFAPSRGRTTAGAAHRATSRGRQHKRGRRGPVTRPLPRAT